jgi:TrmH family RNA methyltransferase
MENEGKTHSSEPGRLSRAEERLLFALRRRAVREERGLFLAEGVRVAEELVRSPLSIALAAVSASLEDTPRGGELVRRIEAVSPVRRVSDEEIRRCAATESPQGIIIAAHTPRVTLERLAPREHATVLALDGVQDPGNFGTLVRSAHAFAADFVLALTGTVDPWNPKSVRAAAGSSCHVPIVQAETHAGLTWLDHQGFAIFAADARGRPVEPLQRPARVALIVGNEGAGVSDAVRAAAAAVVAVPIRGSAESLNVGVAAGILLYLLTREA